MSRKWSLPRSRLSTSKSYRWTSFHCYIFLIKMRLGYLALVPLWLWPWASFAASAAATDAQCAFLPFGRPKASDCVYIVNHIMPEGDDPIGFVLRNYPKRPYMSIPIFWFYSQSICLATLYTCLLRTRDMHHFSYGQRRYPSEYPLHVVGFDGSNSQTG